MDPDLKTAVERLHDCKASFVEDIVVVEKFREKTVGRAQYCLRSTRPSKDQSCLCLVIPN
jgi:hypothetical protein